MKTQWSYAAISRTGQEVQGLAHGPKADVLRQLHEQHMQVVHVQMDCWAMLRAALPKQKPSSVMLAQLFEDIHNMLLTGMTLGQVFKSLQETVQDVHLKDILIILDEQISQGQGLAEAITQTKAFPWLVCATLQAGEQTGKLTESFQMLGRYFRRQAQTQDTLGQALVYPAIVFAVLTAVMMFVGLKVVPQLQTLLPQAAMGHSATQLVLMASAFLRQNLWFIGTIPILFAVFFVWASKEDPKNLEQFIYRLPLIGAAAKESALAHYFLNISVLLKSGIPLLKSISDLNSLYSNTVSEHFAQCREYMYSGMRLWEAVKRDGFFPLVVSFTIYRGEETAKLDEYCFNLSEYFYKRANAKVEVLIHLIQPMLLILGGLFLAVIAFAFLVPIYGSLTKIAGG